jgi:hypothetical protein
MNKCHYTAVFVTGFAVLVLCTPARAQDSRLNSPVSRQPTVGSEITRGDAAASECTSRLWRSGRTLAINLSNFEDCVNDAVRDNRQKSTLSEPFEFGLYLAALFHCYAQKIPFSGGIYPPVWHDRVVKIIKSKKLSFGDWCKATSEDFKKCSSGAMPFFEAIMR